MANPVYKTTYQSIESLKQSVLAAVAQVVTKEVFVAKEKDITTTQSKVLMAKQDTISFMFPALAKRIDPLA